MKKRILSLFLITVMILSTFAIIPVSAAENTFNANDAEPVITTLEDLNNFDKAIEDGNYFTGKTVKLAGNIELPSTFTGIGAQDKGFGGIFDGQGHTITMSGHTQTGGWDGALFVCTQKGGSSATIKNLNLNGTMKMTGGADSGRSSILLRRPYTPELLIENVHISVDVAVDANLDTLGAFIGDLNWSGIVYTNILIKGCVYDGTMTCNKQGSYATGFVGYTSGTNNERHLTIQDCVYAGKVEFKDKDTSRFSSGFIGAIAGGSNQSFTIKDCYSIGTMTFVEGTAGDPNGIVIGQIQNAGATINIENVYYVDIKEHGGSENVPVVGQAKNSATYNATNVVAKTKAEIAALTTGAFSNNSTMTFKTAKVDNVNLYYPAPAGLVTKGWLPSLSVVSGNATVLGAQIRCTGAEDDYSGIRFVSVFNKSAVTGAQTTDANFGIILIAKSKLDTMEGDVTIANLKAAGGIDIQATNATEVGDYYRVNAVVYDIDSENYEDEIVAYTYVGEALVGESVTRSIYEVAELCLKDANATEAQKTFCATIVPTNND